jgi:hypothetical protein
MLASDADVPWPVRPHVSRDLIRKEFVGAPAAL